MEQITIRLPVRLLAELEREARESNRSRSEHIRDVLESRTEHDRDAPDHERVRDLEAEIADLERTIEAQRNQMQVLTEAYQAASGSANLVPAEENDEASVIQRTKWWLFGRND